MESQTSPQPSSPLNAQPPAPVNPPAKPTTTKGPNSSNKIWLALIGGILLITIVASVLLWHNSSNKSKNNVVVTKKTTAKVATTTSTQPTSANGLQLDPNKNYGNKYANGILPVGDGKYSTTSAKTGYIYTCSKYAQNLINNQGGAGKRGPWFTNNNANYDSNKKLQVLGSVKWQAEFSNDVTGATRTIVTNDLPTHPTGTFPISPSDPAYAYDRNPNSIKGQTLTYSLAADPTYSATPNCLGGEAGIMLSGIALFNGFDAAGRDAGAWEVQDSCQGHPQSDGIYHYHTLSSCIKNVSVKTVIGFALDGFPITGPQVGANNILTTSDLDECHGLTSSIVLDGKTVSMYHYVMTEDFPYSVSCFRGTAIQPPDLKSPGTGHP